MPSNPGSWYSRMKRIVLEGPYQLTRRPIPSPGSENLIFLTWALPGESPINYAIPNHRTFQFQEPLVVSNHLVGLTGPSGYEVTYPYTSTPLTVIQPTSPGPEIVIYG